MTAEGPNSKKSGTTGGVSWLLLFPSFPPSPPSSPPPLSPPPLCSPSLSPPIQSQSPSSSLSSSRQQRKQATKALTRNNLDQVEFHKKIGYEATNVQIQQDNL